MEDSVLEDLLVSAWGGLAPYIMPVVLVLLVVAFRIWLAEILAEVVYVFRRKLEFLRWGRLVAPGHLKVLEQVWNGVCLWKKIHRSNYGISEKIISAMNDATMDLINVLELGLPYYDEEIRSLAEEIMRECVREQQIWQGAKEKSEVFLRDYQSALDKIENKVSGRLMPVLEKNLRG